MTTNELWQELITHETNRAYFSGKAFIGIPVEVFDNFKIYFKPQFALLNRLENFRSAAWWKHIHVIKNGDRVQIHRDHGNPNVSVLLNIPHCFMDVLPYFIWCLLTWRKPYKF